VLLLLHHHCVFRANHHCTSKMSSGGDEHAAGGDEHGAEAESVEGETISATVDGRLRTVKRGINTCKICRADILLEDKGQIAECFIDGRLACQKCRDALNTAFATAQYFVCINVLCRRKWKQLSPRVVSFFCPSCRKCLEAKLRATNTPELQDLSDLAYLQLMYKFWIQVIKVLSDKIPFEWAQKDEVTEFILEDDLQTTLNVFSATFNAFDVPMESCRNWNSMLVRKKYYKGYIESKDPETRLCHIAPLAELKENFSPIQKTINQRSTGSFFVLDWKDELQIGEEVYFIAFPNPVQEKLKDYVRHIIKVIRGPDSPISENPETPTKQQQGAKNNQRNSMENTNNVAEPQKDTKNNKKNNNKEKNAYNNNNNNKDPNINSQKGGRGKGNQNNQQNYHNQQGLNNVGTPTHIGRSISASSISSIRDLHYMVPAKIESPYASPLLEPMEPSMTTPVVTSKDLLEQLRTPSYFTPPYRPWKVVPLLSSIHVGDRENSIIMSSPPPGFNELPGPDGAAAASSSNGDGEGMDGFNDLMQWTDDRAAGDNQKAQWYDPLREQQRGYRRSDTNLTFASVPEDQPIDPNFEWSMPRENSRMNIADSKRNYVPPQSPWAAYFGD